METKCHIYLNKPLPNSCKFVSIRMTFFYHQTLKGLQTKLVICILVLLLNSKQGIKKVFLIEGYITKWRVLGREEEYDFHFLENPYPYQFQTPEEVRPTKAIFYIHRWHFSMKRNFPNHRVRIIFVMKINSVITLLHPTTLLNRDISGSPLSIHLENLKKSLVNVLWGYGKIINTWNESKNSYKKLTILRNN